MPIYEYECGHCGARFEKRRSISQDDNEIACPTCGHLCAERVFSVFGTISSGASGCQAACPTGGST